MGAVQSEPRVKSPVALCQPAGRPGDFTRSRAASDRPLSLLSLIFIAPAPFMGWKPNGRLHSLGLACQLRNQTAPTNNPTS